MGIIIKDTKLVIITKSKTIYFDLSEKIYNNLKNDIDFIITKNMSKRQKNEISRLLSKYMNGTDIHEHIKN